MSRVTPGLLLPVLGLLEVSVAETVKEEESLGEAGVEIAVDVQCLSHTRGDQGTCSWKQLQMGSWN